MHRVVVTEDGDPVLIRVFPMPVLADAFIAGFQCAAESVSADSLGVRLYEDFVALYPNVDLSGVEVRG